jgi:endonuclease/exonuclease/phosphatase family metal-dependent hydrolase
VANNFPGLPSSRAADQAKELAALFPGYHAIFGAAVEIFLDRKIHQFGNMIISKLPVLQVSRHLLPWPADPENKSMRRLALEIAVAAGQGPTRIITTHLESFSKTQRLAQAQRLRELYAEAYDKALREKHTDDSLTPFRTVPRALSTIITGDFNARPNDPTHEILSAPFADGTPGLADAWNIKHGAAPHDHTFGIYCCDRARFPDAPLCFDYIYVTEDIGKRIVDIEVNKNTDASDHQPMLLTLE